MVVWRQQRRHPLLRRPLRKPPKGMLVQYTFKGALASIDLTQNASVAEFQAAFAAKSKLSVQRQSVKLIGRLNPKLEQRLSPKDNLRQAIVDFDVKHGEEPILAVKDLGPQFSYRGVFLVEYAGPILIMIIVGTRPAILYGERWPTLPWTNNAIIAYWLWIAHFVKRELETVFVHRFSRPTMPLLNLFKNSIYYWSFAALVSHPLCSPYYMAASPDRMTLGAIIFLIAELVNGAVHIQLRLMRPAEGSTSRNVPSGPLFLFVTCPNYTAEVLTWVGFSLMTNILMSWVFTVIGLLQMGQWALQKHAGYKKQNPALTQKAIIPFLL